jgi:tRNA 5-methylaminomethyl-2-thiouridine biosynthesis bifunctional protein
LVGELLDSAPLKSKPPRISAKSESLPWIKGLYINVAHGSRGFTSAPYCAEFLAQIICQEPLSMNLDLAGLLNPNRFLLRKLGLKRLAKMFLNSEASKIG